MVHFHPLHHVIVIINRLRAVDHRQSRLINWCIIDRDNARIFTFPGPSRFLEKKAGAGNTRNGNGE